MPTIHITICIREEDKFEGRAQEEAYILDKHIDHLKPGLAKGLFERLVSQAIRNYHKRNETS